MGRPATTKRIVKVLNWDTVKLLYSGHPWDVANWLLHKGGLIIQCTFNMQGRPPWDIIRWLF